MCDDSGILTREFRARVLNVSRSGCLIECYQSLEVGTFGSLRLQIGTEEYLDDVEVVRCQHIQGAGSVFHVGVRFLRTAARHAPSIRHAVARYGNEFSRAGTPTPVAEGEKR
jgi:PilZ domain